MGLGFGRIISKNSPAAVIPQELPQYATFNSGSVVSPKYQAIITLRIQFRIPIVYQLSAIKKKDSMSTILLLIVNEHPGLPSLSQNRKQNHTNDSKTMPIQQWSLPLFQFSTSRPSYTPSCYRVIGHTKTQCHGISQMQGPRCHCDEQ